MNKIEQKQIEEMAKHGCYDGCASGLRKFCDEYDGEPCKNMVRIASGLYEQSYRNCKDKVVLSKEEQDKILQATQKRIEQLKKERNDYKQRYESAEKRYEQLVQSSCEALAKKGKETAREIIAKVKQALNYLDNEWEISNALYQIKKQYGVEVE